MDQPINIGGGKQLFLDDQLIDHRQNVELVVNRPQKECMDVLTPQTEWEDLNMGQGVIRHGDRLYMYYCGYDVPHGHPKKEHDRSGVFRRVSLRPDGYMSADAAYEGGELLTKPFVFTGRTLQYNVDLSAGGVLWTEIQDPQSNPIQGFTRSDSDRITGNHLEVTASWKGSSDLSALAGTPIRLQIQMRDSKLYAFEFAN